MDSKRLAIRRIALPCILLAFILVFVGVLVKVQLVDGKEYASAVNTAKQTTVTIHAARGEIVDRNGKPIVENRQGYSIVFNYSYFPSKKENAERNSIIISLIRLFEANNTEWENDLPIVIDASGGLVYKADSEKEIEVMKGKDYLNLNSYATAQNCYDAMVEMFEIDPSYSLRDGLKIAAVRYQMLLNGFGVSNSYTFAEDVSDVLVAKVKENSATFKGVDVEVVPYRHIVDGTLAAHIIGTVGKINAEEYAELKEKGYGMNDMVGKSGIEYSMEEYLRGTDGEKVVTVDPDGNVSETVTKEPVQGATVVLTIDADMQKLAQDTFAKWTENYAKSSKNKYGVPAAGALVVNDPNTGEILTILSYPTYDLNTYSEKYSELSKDERTILDDVFDASETIVAEVMRPRADVVFLDGSQSIKDAAAYVREMPYSRYPVTGRDFDDVIGFVHVRDLLDVRDPNATTVADVTREGISLPGTSKLLPSLELLRKRGIHLAVVIDEYGGTDGIVTLEDMTEELVGDIRDEYDLPSEPGGERKEQPAFVSGVATIDASMTIEDFADLTGIELEDGPYETVAGYFLAHTGKMGAEGDVLHSDDGYDMTVTKVDGRRIETIEVRKAGAPDHAPVSAE